MEVYDGYFEVINKKENGTYLKIFKKKKEGKDVDFFTIINYLDSKGFENYDEEKIRETLDNLKEDIEIKISNKIIESIDEAIEIIVSEDRLKAYVRFAPPIGEGKILTKVDVIDILSKNNITYGVNEDEISAIIESKVYFNDYLIAQGKEPQEGKDAVIKYYFSTNTNTKPKENDDGSVDFHQLNIINNVKDGDLLAELIPAVEGEHGIDVYGNKIKVKSVKRLSLKPGKNVELSEDKLKLFARKDGDVKVEDGKVIVYDYFEVPADVDSSTGNIDFNGTVVVRGNVRTGYIIKAKGDIEVYGVVEGATLISEGEVILRRGIQGMGKGRIEAQGNLISKFIENSTVKVRGFIHSEAILHSNVTAKNEIIVDGKKGMVTGGEVRSGTEVQAKTLGSHMGTVTNVEVGVDPTIIDEYNQAEKDIKNIKEEQVKMDQIIKLLKSKQQKNGTLDPDKLKMLQDATRNKIFLQGKLKTSMKKHQDLDELLENQDMGKVKVMNKVYPGVRITICNAKLFVKDENHYCTYYKDRADIKTTSYA
ncbi:hypothetical protein EDC19_0322 [Natranaerovirga hydrolytica]|uniref:Flagellar Assembly Protein A N-terminal region domain-containing protein n=1 Tax=Natranaerovirga hydrolytica TaxID=680378 RepID=A0A4R1MZ85_9FIRM|nr:FapA family protein [Natranaerovirga hydrolytica]TCK97920.1 hypothetical protein EDC19_0322 [Natranaerovirga hydrolytica]